MSGSIRNEIEPFCIEAGAVSPGGSAAIGLRVNGVIRAQCIGSGSNLRDAKAAALRNARQLLSELKKLEVIREYANDD